MRLLALLHRWTGGITGLLLAVIGLSGAVLVWEETWIALPGADDPYRSGTADLARAVAVAAADERGLSRITFADEGFGLHLAIYRDGGGAYIDQGGRIVESWANIWGRPELWLFDLHHHLFAGRTGTYVAGVLGLLLIAFAVSGIILWWRTRRTFRFRLWPARMTRSAIVWHHRDLGILAAPLLLVSAATGSLIVFKPLSDALLSPWAGPAKPAAEIPPVAGAPSPLTDWQVLLADARSTFPDAAPRRLQLPAGPGEPVLLRMRQSFEWTPNGRTYVYLDPADGRVVAYDDPARGDAAQAIHEKFYPLHAGKVGGVLWRIALTFSGFALALLGLLASWSFWFAKPAKRQPQPHRSRAQVLVEPAE